MKQIIESLLLNTSSYLWLFQKTFTDWCAMYSQSDEEFQRMLANPKIYNWFMREYQSLECVFISEVLLDDQQISFTLKELRELYDSMTCIIANRYPKSLLRELRKNKVVKIKYKKVFNLN